MVSGAMLRGCCTAGIAWGDLSAICLLTVRIPDVANLLRGLDRRDYPRAMVQSDGSSADLLHRVGTGNLTRSHGTGKIVGLELRISTWAGIARGHVPWQSILGGRDGLCCAATVCVVPWILFSTAPGSEACCVPFSEGRFLCWDRLRPERGSQWRFVLDEALYSALAT